MNRFTHWVAAILTLAGMLASAPADSRDAAAGADAIGGADTHWLMMVATRSTDPTRLAQFNSWYDQIDIPDVLEVPGYKRARRGQRLDFAELPRIDRGDDGTYVALYDIVSPNIDRTIIDMLMATRKMEARGRSTDLLKVTERLYFRQARPAVASGAVPHPGKKQFLLLERVDCCRDDATATQLEDWYDTRHVPDMLAAPGVLRATRYELYRVLMVEPKSAPRFLTVYEVEAGSAAQVVSTRQSLIHKLLQQGRLSDWFQERGTAVFLQIKDVAAP